MTKRVRVEWRPLGVIGAIVPWNYPFHNVFNPIISALFAGNGIVIKARGAARARSRDARRVVRFSRARTPPPPNPEPARDTCSTVQPVQLSPFQLFDISTFQDFNF